MCALHDLHNSYPFRPVFHNEFNQLKNKVYTSVYTWKEKPEFQTCCCKVRQYGALFPYKASSGALDSTTHTHVGLVCDGGRGGALAYTILKISIPVSRKTRRISRTQISGVREFMKIIFVYYENKPHPQIHCDRNTQLPTVEARGTQLPVSLKQVTTTEQI